MNKSNYCQLMIGLPASGKTTFLAALWYVVAHAPNKIKGALILESLEGGDKEYINKICDLWSNASPIGRTNIGQEENVSMILQDQDTKKSIEFNFPDLSGESYQQQWINRSMTQEYVDIVKKSCGFMLLIHPENVFHETLIAKSNSIAIKLQKENGSENLDIAIEEASEDEIILDEEASWNIEKAPTQLQLVELLQFVSYIKKDESFKLAVIVSAWDTVTESYSPMTWIEKKTPLLYQYVISNKERIKNTFYGISAQGDDLDNADELLKITEPEKRIKVIASDNHHISNDITVPVRWLMES